MPRGITLVEVVVVIGIVVIIAVLGFPFASTFENARRFEVAGDEMMATLRRAQGRAAVGEGGSAYGVHFVAGTAASYTLFRGNSFSGRDESYDEVYELPGTVTLAFSFAGGGSDVVFLPLRGRTANAGTLTLTGTAAEERRITVNAEGKSEID